jgi:hypothetical protein
MLSRERELSIHRGNVAHFTRAVMVEPDAARRRQMLETLVDEMVLLSRLVDAPSAPADEVRH